MIIITKIQGGTMLSLVNKWPGNSRTERAEGYIDTTEDSKVSIGVFQGGGKLGLISVILAERFEQLSGKPFHESFDRLHGTSVGAINAALFWPLVETGQPVRTPTEAREGYVEEMDSLFPVNWLSSAGGLFGSKYSAEKMEQLFNEKFGDLKLSDFEDGLYIHVVDFDTKEEISLNSKAAKTDPTKDFYMRDLLRAAIAFPLGFDQTTIRDIAGNERHFTDGGVYAPDPSFVVYHRTSAEVPSQNIVLTSFGTGKQDQDLKLTDLNDGVISSGKAALKAVFLAASQTNETLLRNAMGNRYNLLDYDITGTDIDMESDMKHILPVAQRAADANEVNIERALAEIAKLDLVPENIAMSSRANALHELTRQNGVRFHPLESHRLQ
ncbi:MAG: hypothetical protein GC137_02850 [Alphaproteobacteria bacterium]|nr:hypothetical protein [Alphaproteobacteria bacterium]